MALSLSAHQIASIGIAAIGGFVLLRVSARIALNAFPRSLCHICNYPKDKNKTLKCVECGTTYNNSVLQRILCAAIHRWRALMFSFLSIIVGCAWLLLLHGGALLDSHMIGRLKRISEYSHLIPDGFFDTEFQRRIKLPAEHDTAWGGYAFEVVHQAFRDGHFASHAYCDDLGDRHLFLPNPFDSAPSLISNTIARVEVRTADGTLLYRRYNFSPPGSVLPIEVPFPHYMFVACAQRDIGQLGLLSVTVVAGSEARRDFQVGLQPEATFKIDIDSQLSSRRFFVGQEYAFADRVHDRVVCEVPFVPGVMESIYSIMVLDRGVRTWKDSYVFGRFVVRTTNGTAIATSREFGWEAVCERWGRRYDLRITLLPGAAEVTNLQEVQVVFEPRSADATWDAGAKEVVGLPVIVPQVTESTRSVR